MARLKATTHDTLCIHSYLEIENGWVGGGFVIRLIVGLVLVRLNCYDYTITSGRMNEDARLD
jgi:hypothetical protein